MSADPAVSVIIPTYNSADYIAQTIQSVLDQDYRDHEIVVVDDGSTDDTRQVLDPFMGKIRYFLTENRRAAHARNVGMREARGRYIASLDSDDLYMPHKLALQVPFMDAHPEVGLVSTEVSSIIGDTVQEEYHLRSYHRVFDRLGWSFEDVYSDRGQFDCDAFPEPVPYFVGNVFRHVLQSPVIMQNTVLFRKEILESVGYHDERYQIATEYELLVRMCKHHVAAFLNVPTYLYRYHENQMSLVGSARTRQSVLTEITIESELLRAVLKWGCGDEEYYRNNSDWLDHRVAVLHHVIGEKWLEIGEAGKARESFSTGHGVEPRWRDNRRSLYASYLPGLVRRALSGIRRRWFRARDRT